MEKNCNIRPCDRCGVDMINPHPHRKYCEDCSIVMKDVWAEKWKTKNKDYHKKRFQDKKLEKESIKTKNNLDEYAKKARELGISYGKYVADYVGKK